MLDVGPSGRLVVGPGGVIGVALMMLGISLFGVVTANLSAYLVEEREDAVLAEVRALRRELEAFRQGGGTGGGNR